MGEMTGAPAFGVNSVMAVGLGKSQDMQDHLAGHFGSRELSSSSLS